MAKTIRALNGGRLRVWWVCNRQDAIRSVQLAAILGLWMLASHFDYRDQLDMAHSAREAAEARADEASGFERKLPRVTFVLDARTPEELKLRLAEIAGGLDGERARMMEAKR